MKPLTKPGFLILLFIFQGVSYSCTDTLDLMGLGTIVEYKEPERKKIYINGRVYADHVAFNFNSPGQSHLKESFIYGSGTFNKEGSVRVSCTHTHFNFQEEGNYIRISGGQFVYVLDTGDILNGTYSGQGDMEEGGVYAELILNISGGTGRFSGASGSIDVRVSPDQVNTSGYT